MWTHEIETFEGNRLANCTGTVINAFVKFKLLNFQLTSILYNPKIESLGWYKSTTYIFINDLVATFDTRPELSIVEKENS